MKKHHITENCLPFVSILLTELFIEGIVSMGAAFAAYALYSAPFDCHGWLSVGGRLLMNVGLLLYLILFLSVSFFTLSATFLTFFGDKERFSGGVRERLFISLVAHGVILVIFFFFFFLPVAPPLPHIPHTLCMQACCLNQ